MNCTLIRQRLSELLYEDLPPADREQLLSHLAQCPECRSEYASLRELKRALNIVSAPEVSVNLPALYQQVADHQARGERRWRRTALALAGLAAALIVGLALRWEIRLGRDQIVIRWTASTPAVEPAPNPMAGTSTFVRTEPLVPAATEAELLPLRGVIYTLAEDMDKLAREVEARDQRQQHTTARLQEQLAQLRIAIQRQVALSLADSSKKGDDR